MRIGVLAIVIGATLLVSGGRVVLGQHADVHGMHQMSAALSAAGTAVVSRFALPTAASTRMLLEGATHNSEFVDVPVGGDVMRAFVSYPDRADRAPVVIVTTSDGMSDRARAIGFQASREGFIAIVPDYPSRAGARDGDAGAGEQAVRRFAAQIPSAGGTIASVGVGDGRIAVGLAGRRTGFALGDAGWSDALAFLREQTGDRFEPLAQMDHVAMEMRGRQANAGAQAASPPRRRAGLDNKPDDLPANWVTSSRIVATTPRRHEWVEVRAGDSTIRTWVVYPDGTERVGAVLVLTGAPGIRDGDWELAVADQLALEGFIALVPDFATGLGPGGGNYDSFRFTDERMQAMRTRDAAERLNLLHAVREYAAKLPRSNGRTGSIGFCGGGSMSFRLATQVPEHNASVVYYGTGPSPELLAKTTAPVIGFYGEDDIRVTSTVEATRTEMQRLEKAYEAHIYPHTTHSFLWMQDLGNNFEATVDSWSRTIRFYRQHLNTPAPAGR